MSDEDDGFNILERAEQILGRAVKVELHRSWAIFWCPFHGDNLRAGQGGHANFGVHIEEGYWKCLRCGVSGGSLASLRFKLERAGKYRPRAEEQHTREVRAAPQVSALDEAVTEARANVRKSPAWPYIASRGLKPYTALTYGLGYGLPNPYVSRSTWSAASQSMLIRKSGTWLWAGSVVYADPPTAPSVINARYLPDSEIPAGTRDFTPLENHKTWGRRIAPLGAWRISSATRTVVVVEGLFDLLVFAQALYERRLDQSAVAVYTNGSSPSAAVLHWFAEHPQYQYLLVRDPDEAGINWAAVLREAIVSGGGSGRLLTPPGNRDPDEAILAGWWPVGL